MPIKKGSISHYPARMSSVYRGAKLVWQNGEISTVTGISPLLLSKALSKPIRSLTQYGKCVQASTPTPSAPVDIVCNNGAVRLLNLADMEQSNLDIGYYINNSGVRTQSEFNFVTIGLLAVKPNTAYTMHASRTLNYFSIVEYDASEGFIGRTLWGTASVKAGDTIAFTTGATTAFIRFGSNIDGTAVTYEAISAIEWMLSEGATAKEYVPYGTLYADGTPEVLTVLANQNTDPTIVKATLASGATEVRYNASSSCIVAPVKPNTTYSIGFLTKPSGGSIFRVVTTKNTVSSSVQSVASIAYDLDMNSYATKTINSGEGAEWMYVQLSNTMSDETFANILIQEGTSLTPPQTVADIPMLLSVGDFKDEGDIISGAVTKRIGYHVFDGTETFSKSSAYGQAFLVNAAYVAWGADRAKAVMCTHFLGLPQKSSAQDDNTCFFNTTGHFYFRVTDNSDVNAWKAWLAEQYAAGTPVIVFFVLAEETTEQTTPHTLTTAKGTNTAMAVTNVDPVELSVTYLMKGGNAA